MDISNHKSRRALQRAPQCVQDLVSQLPGQVRLLHCRPGAMGWQADIIVDSRKIRLVYDRGYFEAYEVTSSDDVSITCKPEELFQKLFEDVQTYFKKQSVVKV